MKVSLPYFAGSTVKTLPKSQSQTEITNSHTSTERQDLPPDHIEISSQVSSISNLSGVSSQFPISNLSDISPQFPISNLSDISPQFPISNLSGVSSPFSRLDRFRLNSQSSISDLSEISEIGENYWDLMETQSEPSNPWIVDSFLQLPQTENQTATQQNPFQNHSATLPSQTALPAKQSPQTDILENPDSNEKKLSKKIKRPSRHPQNQDILTSEQTDDEFESEDTAIKRKTKARINKRRSRLKRAREITGNPNARGADYDRIIKANRAKKQTGNSNATDADYNRLHKVRRAIEMSGNPNATHADYDRLIKTWRARK